ncbi:hypothetical protein GBA63_01195 [Rubrobacter tropicus]|uniref:Calcium-binding protein n=1 Tax=Rubrobacter tropicus TaxID=2653851 RepID=A0A6G8Q4L9_9ACTN|nr:hypothetical protein [Rubrobacter tropicus]QIN81393.1 hypothetical protein GBA63_01195 [Rubrobacter tropicus]
MRRRFAVILVAVSVLIPTLGGGAALAATLIGTGGPDRIVGSVRADWIDGRAGDDRISGGGGEDRIQGGPGNDLVRANDDWSRDYVDCGPGFDTVSADPGSSSPRDLYVDCEFRSAPYQPTP